MSELLYRKHSSVQVLKSDFYFPHVLAMTAEDLYSKAEIAEELAYRDIQIAELRAERDALKADAERYRWLRENLYVEDGCLEMAKNIYCHTAPNKADIDAAIDAARGERT